MDSIKENIRIGIAVKGNVLHIPPVFPAKFNIGANTTIVVSTPKNTGVNTSIVPLIVDVILSSLSLIRRLKTFSPTIIASSTTIPNTTININADKTFTVTPICGSIIRAPPKEIGIPIATQNATEGLRNMVNKNNTKTIPIAKFL